MNDYTSRWEKDNREFASKKLGLFIYTPCWIAIGAGCLHIAMGMTPEAGPYIVMGSLLALVCGSLGLCRKKIIQQDKAIRLLQEKLDGWFKNRAEKNPDKFTYKAEQARAALIKQDTNKDDELTLDEWTK